MAWRHPCVSLKHFAKMREVTKTASECYIADHSMSLTCLGKHVDAAIQSRRQKKFAKGGLLIGEKTTHIPLSNSQLSCYGRSA
ncbi:protein of unknown function (plasmid) [Cupriavidus taiwanensis]|uniref:Uncharacterized protein n=1 Tax=Cupriavidus taiwanensis TaxID=164546 RepID=A0A375IQX4_9BURK|nr:protein of unknown function [Cupriavidus taiwanensis]